MTDAFLEKGIEIVSIVAPDGFTDEALIDKEVLRVILDANKNGGGAYGKYFDTPRPEIIGVSDENFDMLSPLFKVSRQLGISFQFNPGSKELNIGAKYGIEWYRKDTPDRKHRGNPVLTLDQAETWRDEMNKKHPDLHHTVYEEDAVETVSKINSSDKGPAQF